VSCIPGQACPQAQQGNMQMQPTPVQQQAQLIAAKERERADDRDPRTASGGWNSEVAKR